jgi:hypothetical protein
MRLSYAAWLSLGVGSGWSEYVAASVTHVAYRLWQLDFLSKDHATLATVVQNRQAELHKIVMALRHETTQQVRDSREKVMAAINALKAKVCAG